MKQQKRKVGKHILAVLAVLVLAAFAFVYFKVPIQFEGTETKIPEALPSDQVLSKDAVLADREQMITYVEDIHPFFERVENQEDYQQAKETYIQATEEEMTVIDFEIATSAYLCFFQDGHTGLKWTEEEYLFIPWTYEDGAMYLMQDDEVTDKKLEAIGGVEMETIFALMDQLYPAENEMAKARNYIAYGDGRNLLTLAGIAMQGSEVEVTLSDGSVETYWFSDNTGIEVESDENLPVNSYYETDDIFVVDFNSCDNNEELGEIAKALKEAVANGTEKVIIDARGNGGGDSNACVTLLNAMGMEAPDYDMFIRYSKEAKKQNGYLRGFGSMLYEGSAKGKANDKVNLVVLCDKDTFSSATMLLVFVRDGGLGTIIGEPSANRPNCYGDIIYFALDNSHLWGTISHKQFIRPDETNTENMLIPDVETSSGDAMDAAITFLNK